MHHKTKILTILLVIALIVIIFLSVRCYMLQDIVNKLDANLATALRQLGEYQIIE